MFYKREEFQLSKQSQEVYNALINPESDLCQIKKEFDFFFIYEEIKDLYCSDDGRNSIDGVIALKAIFIQNYFGLSERQLERKAIYDLEIKHFLDININDKPFDFSTVWKFKNKLGKEKTKCIFNEILAQIKAKKIIKTCRRQAIDTVPILAAAALPSVTCLIYQAIKEVCKNSSKELLEEIFKETELNQEKIDHYSKPRALFQSEDQDKIRTFQKAIKRAFAILELVQRKEIINESINILKTILQDNAELNPDKKYQEKQTPHAIKSLVDPDAGLGHKTQEKKVFGYKAGISVTPEGITTSYNVTSMSKRDDEHLKPILEMQEQNGTKCEEADADSAFGFIQNFADAEEANVILHAPLRNIDPEKLSAYDFNYNKEKNELTCINGITVKGKCSGSLTFDFPLRDCRCCPKSALCPLAPSKRVTIHKDNDVARRALARQREDDKLRKENRLNGIKGYNRLIVENVFAFLEKLGIKNTPAYSLNNTEVHVSFVLTVANMVKSVRILKKLSQTIKSTPLETGAFLGFIIQDRYKIVDFS